MCVCGHRVTRGHRFPIDARSEEDSLTEEEVKAVPRRTNKPAPEGSGEARTPGLTLEGIRTHQGAKHRVTVIGCAR